jgi:hypothetical protein
MNVMRHSLLLDAVKTRLSVPSIAVRLHIENTTLPLYLGFFEFVHNVRKRGKALLGALIELLVS